MIRYAGIWTRRKRPRLRTRGSPEYRHYGRRRVLDRVKARFLALLKPTPEETEFAWRYFAGGQAASDAVAVIIPTATEPLVFRGTDYPPPQP